MPTTARAQDSSRTDLKDQGVQPNPAYDGRFTFARLYYAGQGCHTGEGPGWRHDYPVAERNLMKIMTEILSSFDARVDSSAVFRPDDPELTKYPVAYLSEPGCWIPSESEVKALRNYLLKGGFLIVDDFRGRHWENFETQMQRVLPTGRFLPVDQSDPLFNGLFEVSQKDLKKGSARGPASESQFLGLYEDNDVRSRMMVIANYNLDIGDYWQWSPTEFLPVPSGNQAYKFGVNYIIYGLSH